MRKYIFAILVLLPLLLVGLLIKLGRKAMKELAAGNPPPGRMVDVDGHQLHLNCLGGQVNDGTPTVVLESGNGECSLGWLLVQQQVARFAPVCSYDRSGLGWSDRGHKPRTTANIVEELHTLLDRAGVEPPFVLVGHSIGGVFIRYYANRYPEQVAGMILVDPGHEDQRQRFPQKIRRLNDRNLKLIAMMLRLGQIMIDSGLAALIPGQGVPGQTLATVPEEAREAFGNLLESRPVLFKTMREETINVENNLGALRAEQPSSLGDMPLIVLSAGRQFGESEKKMLKRIGVSDEDLWQLQVVAGELHDELAALSSAGRRVLVKESGHHIQVEQPEQVVEAIRQVVEAVKVNLIPDTG